MRPLDVLALQSKHKLDFTAVCVLDLIGDFTGIVSTDMVVEECLKDKISSPATTFRKLTQLKKLNFVSVEQHPTHKDRRKKYLAVTSKGHAYLKKWGGE